MEQLKFTETREKSKVREYEEIVRQEGMAFLPFIMETYGAFGKQALSILDELATEAAQNGLHQIGGMKFSLFAIRDYLYVFNGGMP